jgi:hypothetical protein
MDIFKKAKDNKIKGFGYCSRKFKIVWENKNISWNWFAIEWGIRFSKKWQIFPIKNVSNNSMRSLMFGFWKLYFQIVWHRKNSFNQKRNLLFKEKLWKFYQLVS